MDMTQDSDLHLEVDVELWMYSKLKRHLVIFGRCGQKTCNIGITAVGCREGGDCGRK